MSVSGELRAAVLRVFLYSVCESGIDGGESAARKRIASRAAAGAGAAVRRILRDSARLSPAPRSPRAPFLHAFLTYSYTFNATSRRSLRSGTQLPQARGRHVYPMVYPRRRLGLYSNRKKLGI